jgi:pseudouridine-5'-phosphate glycosidase
MIAAHAAGISVFATGGIGGVHRGAFGEPAILGVTGTSGASGWSGGVAMASRSRASLDVSSDLEELARTPVAVVCAGPKAILDVPATLEYLETRGVPVVAVGQDALPGFFARSSGIAAPSSVPDIEAAADIVRIHLGLGLDSGIVVAVPVPSADALPEAVAEEAIETAIVEAAAARISGPALTPWLLARIAALTGGASIRANTSLIVNDARIAGLLAAQVSR